MAFVLLSFPRCGTHMLRSALNNHPDIICHNEIFNTDVIPEADIVAKGAAKLYFEHTGDHEGFTVHGYTPSESFRTGELTQSLWPVLQEEKPTIIVLDRLDLLRRCISASQAQVTKRWQVSRTQNQAVTLAPLTLKPAAVQWGIDTALKARAQRETLFPDAHVFWYEQLVTYWERPLAEIQRLIGVVPRDVYPTTAKIDKRPIVQTVSNYRELKDHFADTEYAKWFKLAEDTDAADVNLLEAP
jgi:hypothetical protein